MKIFADNIKGDNNNLGHVKDKDHVKTPRRSFEEFFRKYFLEGQRLEGSAAQILERIPEDAGFEEKLLTKYRKYIAVLIPFTICQFLWWCTAIKHDFLALYSTKWEMPLTMIFGATIGVAIQTVLSISLRDQDKVLKRLTLA
uniref:Uncharacterized protein n=1 Tax=Acrobeloides nanus TaxID=290746 RepID=A0A914CR13_9BILA